MANADVVQRLFDELAAFEAGVIDLPELELSLWAHGSALEGMPGGWHEQLGRWEGALELARFTQGPDAQAATASGVISEVRQALREVPASSASCDEDAEPDPAPDPVV
jgi:hypothetical protein